MSLENVVVIISILMSLSVGTIFGTLRSKIFLNKHPTALHFVFIIFSILTLVLSLFVVVWYRNPLFWKESGIDYFRVTIIVLTIIVSVVLLIVTKKYLIFRDVFKVEELDPIVNDFTEITDNQEIKLFGGDLNFFGENPKKINCNPQYIHLRSQGFKHVKILCEEPKNKTQEVRYGKILREIDGSELRFYNPESADLRVRGRIIKVNGSDKLLMYKKVKSGYYQAIKTDTADSNGALYSNIWNLVWDLAGEVDEEDVEKLKNIQ